jgi:phospholipid/cholesterol/gamma-HCH transport system ATP-binding protein
LIRLSAVGKSYGRPVLTGIDWHVPRGCLYGLIGPGASGKSVLVKIISGLIRPDAGKVVVDELDLAARTELELQQYRARVGMLFQNNALFDFMTVAENIAFPLRRLSRLDEAEIARKVSARLAVVGLPGFEDRLPRGLSGGQKKRVGIARSSVTEPKLLLYDEPAAGLDPVSSQKIFELLAAEQRASGATVIMVSSDIARLLSVTDRVAMMLDGRIVFDGTTAEALACPEPHVHQFVHGETDGPL